MSGQKNKTIWILILLVILGSCLAGTAVSRKQGMHVDEYYSYGLSNNMGIDIHMSVELGNMYDEPLEPFHEYMSVDENSRFSYGNVWEKQTADVHPPAYYVILHTICSFFPEVFSIWFSAGINIFFFALTIVFVYLTMKDLCKDKKSALIAAAFCALSGGMIQIDTFLRMYSMMMFLTAALTWLHVKYYEKQTKTFFLLYPLLILIGFLTHYYFIVFLALQGIYFGISLLIRKRLKNAMIYLGETVGMLCASIAIFPAMIEHIFFGYRGKESVGNLLESSGYFDGLRDFANIISQNLTGGLFYGILLLFIGVLIYRKFGKKVTVAAVTKVRWGMLWIPSILFYLLISKIAVYHYDRYISIIYPVLILIFIGMVDYIGKIIIRKVSVRMKLTYLLLGTCIILSYIKCDWTYLQKDTADMVTTAKKYSEYDCIIVNNGINFWNHTLYYEVENYQSLTFLSDTDMGMYASSEVLHVEPVVVYVMDCVGDRDGVLNSLLEQNPAYSEVTHIVDSNFANGYLLK